MLPTGSADRVTAPCLEVRHLNPDTAYFKFNFLPIIQERVIPLPKGTWLH